MRRIEHPQKSEIVLIIDREDIESTPKEDVMTMMLLTQQAFLHGIIKEANQAGLDGAKIMDIGHETTEEGAIRLVYFTKPR